MLPETDAAGAAQFVARVRGTARRAQRQGLPALALSLGAATSAREEPLRDAISRADAAMYAEKKRHAARRRRSSGKTAS